MYIGTLPVGTFPSFKNKIQETFEQNVQNEQIMKV